MMPVDGASTEPRSMASERKFLIEHIERYFGRRPQGRGDSERVVGAAAAGS